MHTTTKPALYVLSARHGLIRAGVAHPACMAHPLDRFTKPQLEELLGEPAISLVVGHQLVSDNLADYLAATEAGTRTHVVGSTIDTDAGASVVTDSLAHREDLRRDVERVEQAAVRRAAPVDHGQPELDASSGVAGAGSLPGQFRGLARDSVDAPLAAAQTAPAAVELADVVEAGATTQVEATAAAPAGRTLGRRHAR